MVVVASLLFVPLTYPYPQQQLRSLRPQSNLAVPLLAVGVTTAAVLVPFAIQALCTQLAHPSGQVAGDTIWATAAEHLLLLALGGVLAATRRPGWQVLVAGIAAVYAYLGVASITLPDQPGSWGTLGRDCLGLVRRVSGRRRNHPPKCWRSRSSCTGHSRPSFRITRRAFTTSPHGPCTFPRCPDWPPPMLGQPHLA
jgi:hypothetical protein